LISKLFSNKIAVIIIVLLTLIFLGFWSPWFNWKFNWVSLLGIDSQNKTSGLKVLSHTGVLDIYIDDKFMGSTVDNENSFDISAIIPGEHIVKLIRKSESGQYVEIIRKLNFEPAVDVIIGYELGPSESFSEGHILYTQKNFIQNKQTTLEIFSNPAGQKVSLDGRYIGDTPVKEIDIDLSSKHKFKFEKAGYDSLEIEILPDTQEDRDKLKGLKLVLEVNLFAQPLEMVNQ